MIVKINAGLCGRHFLCIKSFNINNCKGKKLYSILEKTDGF